MLDIQEMEIVENAAHGLAGFLSQNDATFLIKYSKCKKIFNS